MMLKTEIYNGVKLYRKGIGYYFKLNKMLQSNNDESLVWILETFTDLKRIKWLMKHKKDYVSDIVLEVMRFNIKKRPSGVSNNDSSTVREVQSEDDIIGNICNLLCKSYGWTIDYVLENIDMFQFDILSKAIKNDDRNFFMKTMMAEHDPKGLIQNLTPEVQELSFDEVMRKISNIKTEYSKDKNEQIREEARDVYIRK